MTEIQTDAQITSPLLSSDTLIKLPTYKFYRQTFLLEEFLSILVWGVTRISYDVNCLVDGARGKAIQPSEGWDTGIIRLLAIAHIKTRAEQTHLEIDCKTKQTPILLLPHNAAIQTDTNLVCREPRQVGSLLQELKQELQGACAETTDFLVPTRLGFPTVEFLEPGTQWRHAEIRLDLEFSLISDSYNANNGNTKALSASIEED